MFLDINRIGSEPAEFDHRLELTGVSGEGIDRVLLREARVRGTLVRRERGVDLEARLEAVVELACGRCLESFRTTIATGFALTLVRERIRFESGETALQAEDLNLFHAEDGRADLQEIAREQVYLNLPLKPVCAAACRGLCPTCGANRNRIECGCRSNAADPRLAPLQELLKRMGDS